jgi:hypothetical protein
MRKNIGLLKNISGNNKNKIRWQISQYINLGKSIFKIYREMNGDKQAKIKKGNG